MYESFYDDALSSDDEIIEFRRQNEHQKRMREKSRKELSNGDTTTDDTSAKVRQMLKEASDRITEQCDEARQRTRARDDEAMQNIEKLLANQHLSPRYATPRGSLPVNVHRRSFARRSPRVSMDDDHHSLSGSESRYRSSSHYHAMEPSASDTARQRMRKVEAHLDGILDYELPSAENYKTMRTSLRDIQDKMNTQRTLLDRKSKPDGVDHDNRNVSERIDEKYRELEDRMPCLSGVQRNIAGDRNDSFDPIFVPGYSTGLNISNSVQNAELRGRIRSLLCRTRDKPGGSAAGHRHHASPSVH